MFLRKDRRSSTPFDRTELHWYMRITKQWPMCSSSKILWSPDKANVTLIPQGIFVERFFAWYYLICLASSVDFQNAVITSLISSYYIGNKDRYLSKFFRYERWALHRTAYSVCRTERHYETTSSVHLRDKFEAAIMCLPTSAPWEMGEGCIVTEMCFSRSA